MLTPYQIIAIKQEASILPPRACGVYFLIDGNEIVYVGRAINIAKRLREHRQEGRKYFDYYSIELCSEADSVVIEGNYIAAFHPKCNRLVPADFRRDIPPALRMATLITLARMKRISIKDHQAFAEQHNLLAINGRYLVADFTELHANPPKQDKILDVDLLGQAGRRRGAGLSGNSTSPCAPC